MKLLVNLGLGILVALIGSLSCPSTSLGQAAFPLDAKRILFMGDSITHAGQYVSWVETQLRVSGVDPLPEMINIGLGSETCSGLSEPDHPFPRPDVHERLDRALEKIKPDVVVACYGMNDGIYYPPSQDRLEAYQDGIKRLVSKVHESGAKAIILTPPPFDALPLRESGKLLPLGEKKYAYFAMYEDYDDVLRGYGEWIMSQKELADMTIDLHGPIDDYVEQKRSDDPKFTLSPDGIHPNGEGHKLIANIILKAWGQSPITEKHDEVFELVHHRSKLLHDAWLSDVGHKRPSVPAGLPLPEAQEKAAELDFQIRLKVNDQN